MTTKPKTENYADRAANEPTDLHRNFAKWIEEKTGQKVDLKTVQLAVSLRMDFQASPENQSHLADRKAEAARRKKASAAAKKAKLEAELAKLKGELDKVETEPTAAAQPAVETAPKATRSRARKAPAKATEAPAQPKPRAARTRKTAAPKVTADVPADFDKDDLEERPEPVKRARRTRAAAPKTAAK